MMDKKDLTTIKRGSIKNQGENWHKMLQKCHMIDFYERNRSPLGLIISEIKCGGDTPIFLQKGGGVNKSDLSLK